MFLDVAAVTLGLALVIRGAEYLLDGALYFVRRFRVPEIVVGLTVVAFGTSLPELVINVIASLRGEAGITVGNIVGSNIANVLLILGISALISPIRRHALILRREIPLNLVLVLLLILFMFLPAGKPVLSRAEGLMLLLFFAGYLYLTLSKARGEDLEDGKGEGSTATAVMRVLGGSIALAFGSNWALNGAVGLAHYLGISEVFIGLFVLAVGTSLPELITSTMAAARGNPYIAIGNVSGSNIFNVAMILGLSALIRPITLPDRAAFDVLFLLLTTVLLLFFTMVSRGNLLGRRRGILFIAVYILYLVLSLKIERLGLPGVFLALDSAIRNLL